MRPSRELNNSKDCGFGRENKQKEIGREKERVSALASVYSLVALNVLSEVCMMSVLLYCPTPLELKAFTRDLYVLLKWSPSTVQMVSVPTYTSCNTRVHTHGNTCRNTEPVTLAANFLCPRSSKITI